MIDCAPSQRSDNLQRCPPGSQRSNTIMHRILEKALIGLLAVMWSPLLLTVHLLHVHDDERRRGIRRQDPPPRAIKKWRRRRALTNPASSARLHQSTQQQSRLLTVLPLEIRRLIWLECVGRMTLHLWIQDRTLSHVQCLSKTHNFCIMIGHSKGCQKCETGESNGACRPSLLPILLACRQT